VSKRIAVYGVYETKASVKQRYWIRRTDGIRQRYWKNTTRLRKVTKSGRYEFHGKGRDLRKAVMKAHRIMPRRFVDVRADKFLKNPEKYGQEGSWVDRKIESG